MIRRVRANNYKSLKSFELELGKFNVLVGANGSGKTNVLDAFHFTRDCLRLRRGVHGAIEARSGWKGISSTPGQSPRVRVGFDWQLDADLTVAQNGGTVINLGNSPRYEFELSLTSGSVEISKDELFLPDHDSTTFNRVAARLAPKTYFSSDPLPHGASSLLVSATQEDQLLLGTSVEPFIQLAAQVVQWQFVDLIPTLARSGSSSEVKRVLEESGANLAVFLANLDHEAHLAVRDAMRRDVPGFLDFSTESAGGYTFFTVDEDHTTDLLASSVSDGTVKLLSIYALYYGQKHPPLLCVEEPENGLHPELIETVVEYLRALSEYTQVIVTTHSPLLVDQCRPEEVVLLDKVAGATRAMRIENHSQIDTFLKDWSLGELWIRELLPLAEIR